MKIILQARFKYDSFFILKTMEKEAVHVIIFHKFDIISLF